MVWEGPGRTERRGNGAQARDGEGLVMISRQSWAVRGPVTLGPSVVLEGVVQWR